MYVYTLVCLVLKPKCMLVWVQPGNVIACAASACHDANAGSHAVVTCFVSPPTHRGDMTALGAARLGRSLVLMNIPYMKTKSMNVLVRHHNPW